MKKNNCAIFEIVCYVVAAVLAVIAVYMTYENVAYISEYAAAYGATFADLGSQAVQSVISAAVPYFTYAFVVFGIGRIYHQVAAPKCAAVEEVAEAPLAVIAEPAEEATEAVTEEPAEEATEEAVEIVEAEAAVAEETAEEVTEEAVEAPKED